MKLLSKKEGHFLNILIIFDLKIYYILIDEYPDTWLIKQVYLLEEIPNMTDFKNRIDYYINRGNYHKLNDEMMDKYKKKIKQIMLTYFEYLNPKYLVNFPDIYDGKAFHPDLIDLYKSI